MWNYKNSKDWKIDDMWSFVVIKSKKIKDKQIEIYANKPGLEIGSNDINSYFSKEFIVPHIVVHRWHSYHSSDTIKEIWEDVKMVFLWSCWWFQNISQVLEKSPTSQIISTKWIWSMTVNDPLFKEINEIILNWEDINWQKIWQKMSKKLENNKKFPDYVRPDKNIWVLFIQKFNEFKKV